ncbi:hypothetical protein [Clostridium paraputrificum]|mgnify:FL=1|jgi:hypothetical protein|uniref:hypothetical protein n=1 Tax=Clostridium paraputrificum TaxID=29363 RepID=UPI000DD01FD8|nr:hypothetical protein [Clostridium paraputrificum]DAU88771.1 MAG TPA: hypothetical protein [Caudoviricetes sp.]
MANISGILEKIRKAIYGKEVRGSLADGLEAINNETENTTVRQKKLETTFNDLIINAGNSNAEIVDARGGETKLKDRLDKFDEKLGEKSNIIVCEEIPSVKKVNTFYFKVTEKQSASGGNQNIKVSPNMGIKIV